MDFKDLTINNTVSAKANLNLIYFRPPAKAGGNSAGGNSAGGNSDGGNSDGGNSDGDKQGFPFF